MLAALLTAGMLISFNAYADEEHDLNSMTMDEIKAYVQELESENLYLREQLELTDGETETQMQQDETVITDYVKDYTGFNLTDIGYTTVGGDLRDRYGKSNVLLVIMSTDELYVDPKDDEQMKGYTVIGQMPKAGTELEFTYNADDDLVNSSYEEIVLVVAPTENANTEEVPELTEITPSTDKSIQYLRDYVGRNLETIGYTAVNGNRYDTYGPDGRVQIVITDEDGNSVDASDTEMLKHYVVTAQNPAPNTELGFSYTVDSDGDEEVTGQTISSIQITAEITEAGQATIAQKESEEAELRASGALKELYIGTYIIGSDLEAGNYTFEHISNSASIYVYADEEAYNNDDGEWNFLYGSGDIGYYALRDGMYFKVEDGAVKSIRSELPAYDGEVLELYSGTFKVGEDIMAGNYEITLISESCSVYLYQSLADFEMEEGDWSFLYGSGDTEYYSLQDGMVLVIGEGAALATRK